MEQIKEFFEYLNSAGVPVQQIFIVGLTILVVQFYKPILNKLKSIKFSWPKRSKKIDPKSVTYLSNLDTVLNQVSPFLVSGENIREEIEGILKRSNSSDASNYSSEQRLSFVSEGIFTYLLSIKDKYVIKKPYDYLDCLKEAFRVVKSLDGKSDSTKDDLKLLSNCVLRFRDLVAKKELGKRSKLLESINKFYAEVVIEENRK